MKENKNLLDNVSLTFSKYKLAGESIQAVYDYLDNKFDKIELLNESGKMLDGFSKEGIFRYEKIGAHSMLKEIKRAAEDAIKEELNLVDSKTKKRKKILIYPTKLDKNNYEYDSNYYEKVSGKSFFKNSYDKAKERVRNDLKIDKHEELSWEDTSFPMEYIQLPKMHKNNLSKQFDDLKPFCELNTMINYAKDLMALRNETTYLHKDLFKNRVKLLTEARKANSLESFLDKTLDKMEFYTKIKYIKDKRLYEQYLRQIYKRAN